MRWMTRASQSLAAALVCGAALLTGCGGDGALSQAEFKKQGNAICQKFLDESKKLEEPQDIGRSAPTPTRPPRSSTT